MTDQSSDLDWRGAVPVSRRFDDPYYSLEDGVAETTHVFLGGNDLPLRFRDGFHVAELGFGTGLNLLVTLAAFRQAGVGGRLHFTSFEAFPLSPSQMIAAQQAFPALTGLAEEFAPLWGATEIERPDLAFRMIEGDARETLSRQEFAADAWYLDGFAPAKNPELWSETLLAGVGALTVAGGTCATYTAAGHVRRALASAGFEITRSAGFGRKRHMTRGRKR